ncbi:hypothetical protein [Streptomyces sp. NPDC002553]|uniref:hypothetical protein n=1 Tax=Streptomyces sp. NPDC002553 TaxID=3154417 RepID=UPI00331EB87F
MNDVIDHPEAARLVDSLVASGGGHVTYDFGAPGRQIAVAAGAHLAARTGMPLTVIDFKHLLPQIRTTVTELHPTLACTPMSAGEAVLHPERNTGGVLVVHADLLHDRGTREALLARAAAADRLIVAGHANDASALHTLPGPRFAVSARAPMPAAPPNASGPDTNRRSGEAIGTSYRFAELRDRQQRFVRQLKQGTPGEHDTAGAEEFTETVSLEEIAEAVQNADPDELRRRIARLQDQRAADPTPQQAIRDHGQAQSAAHQQQGHQSLGLT